MLIRPKAVSMQGLVLERICLNFQEQQKMDAMAPLRMGKSH